MHLCLLDNPIDFPGNTHSLKENILVPGDCEGVDEENDIQEKIEQKPVVIHFYIIIESG
jgi:hypothetical protein